MTIQRLVPRVGKEQFMQVSPGFGASLVHADDLARNTAS
jgi:hypothetical protein